MNRTLALAFLAALLALAGCTAPDTTTKNSLRTASDQGAALDSNTGQNTQQWPDGSAQTGATQLDSGVITPDATNWMSSSPSGILSISKLGVQVRNPGDLGADSLSITFGEPFTDELTGETIVPITAIEIAGLVNDVSGVITASTAQVELWAAALADLSADQRDAVLAALERDKVLTTETVGAVRAALETAASLASPTP
jgi:hypothetical protein